MTQAHRCKDIFEGHPLSLVGLAGGASCEAAVPQPGYMCPVHSAMTQGTKETPEAEEPQPSPSGKGEHEPKHPQHAEAVAYAKVYEGTFDFLQQMRFKIERVGFRGLSDAMVVGILKCKAADERKEAAKAAPASGLDLHAVVPTGRTYAAVENKSGEASFFIIDVPKDTSNWAGWVFVKQQIGPNEERIGKQRPGDDYGGLHVDLLAKVIEDIEAAVIRYGRELGVCGACGLALTNAESRRLGIGPVCRKKRGWSGE